ncbi:hypothetical protein KO566_04210 [Flavobacteriaceae bacterium XHP0103]|uniref:hypothetical protein n=1 Tax=Marixanthotalea marina TaxID=2844359 RepID=UPI002989EC09|nr:hypothetical protein [Marixanthotalea marina]MBU3821254.1 hypothetical protein [Marixanthotalea marina]
MNSSHARLLGQQIFEHCDIAPIELGITPRQINYWIKKILIPFVERQDINENKRLGRVRLNLANAIWAYIIKELLDVGVSSKRLAKLAKKVWDKPRKDKYADKVIRKTINRNNGSISNEDIEILKNTLEDDLLMGTLRMEINPFTDMIKSWLLNKEVPHALVYIPKTGEHEFLMNDGKLNLKLASLALESSIVTVPLAPILLKVVSIDIDSPKPTLGYLNSIEQQIRDIVVFKKPKEVQIVFENGQLKPIIITEKHKTKEQLARYILENKIEKGSKMLIDIRSQGNYKLTLIKK